MELFGVGIGEAGLVLLITLLVVGPERFPQIAREGGKYYRMARRFTAEVTGDLRVALNELENEVNEQTGDLKAVREIGDEVRAGVAESATDMDSISRATADAARPASGDTLPSAAAPEARREVEPVRPAPPTGGDPFARVAAVYSDYHQRDYHQPSTPAPTSTPAPAKTPSSAERARDADGEGMSRQAVETSEADRRPAAEVPAAAPPYSPQSIVGVNPFASADPPPPPAAAPPAASSEGPRPPAPEASAPPEQNGANSATEDPTNEPPSTSSTAATSSTRAPGA